MMGLWGRQITPSLTSHPGLLWPGVVAPERVLSMGQIEQNCVLMLNWIVWNRTVLAFKLRTYAKRRWYSDSGKYTQPSQNTTEYFGTSRRRHWPPCQCTQNWIHVLYSNRQHFLTRWKLSETGRQIHLPWKQCLINRKKTSTRD